MLTKKIIGLTVVWILGLNSVAAFDFSQLDENLNQVDVKLEQSFKKIDTELEGVFSKIDAEMLKFEEKMDLFEKELDKKLELVWKNVDLLLDSVDKELDKTFANIEKLQEDLTTKLTSELTSVIDSKLENIYNKIETKIWSEKMIKSIDWILWKIDKLKTTEKFQSGKNKDLLSYLEGAFKQEQLKQAKKVVTDKASDEKVTKEEFENINELLSSLTEED